jgi:hypothetical protein
MIPITNPSIAAATTETQPPPIRYPSESVKNVRYKDCVAVANEVTIMAVVYIAASDIM